MKNGRLQLKDIDDEPILRFLLQITDEGVVMDTGFGAGDTWTNHNGTWFRWGDDNEIVPPNSIWNVLDPSLPERLVVRKMAKLIARKLVDGCPCGCRGDYQITDRGRMLIGAPAAPEKELRPAVVFATDADIQAQFAEWSRQVMAFVSDHAMPAMAGAHQNLSRILEAAGYRIVVSRADDLFVTVEPTELRASELLGLKPQVDEIRPQPSYLDHDPTKRFGRVKKGKR